MTTTNLRRSLHKTFANQDRDPRYVFTLIVAALLFTMFTIQAFNGTWLKNFEHPVFHAINSLPTFLGAVMYIITQFGSLGALLFWIPFSWRVISRRMASMVTISGLLSWFAAKIAKNAVQRDRPEGFFQNINFFHEHHFSGFGFPSGHSTLSAAVVTTLYFYTPRRYRKYLLLTALAVGISRIYLGAHMPLDVVGGWSLGIICGSLVNLALGNQTKRLSAARIKRALKQHDIEAISVRAASVDARGSTPVTIVTANNQTMFGKLFGEQEHAADWLFKIYRFFRFKNLHGEDPFLNPKRNLEIESFAAVWAKRSGVRTPEIIDLFRIGSRWLLIQEQIEATPLSEYKKVRSATLEDIWKQVQTLHAANIAHRDLRAANIMVDKQGRAWLIDFGFAEVASTSRRKHIDIAELLMSMALIVDVNRTIIAARKHIPDSELIAAIPYLQKAVFSGATTSALKQNKNALPELRWALRKTLKVKEPDDADIDRFKPRKILNIVILAVFIYVVLPQFQEFRGLLDSLDDVQWVLVPIALLASLGTYVAAAMAYVVLAPVPINTARAILVQVASSFMSKILPGGIGGTALIAKFLYGSGLDKVQTSAAIAIQNVLSTISFVVPLALLLLVSGKSFTSIFQFHAAKAVVVGVGIAGMVAVVILITSKKLRRKVRDLLRRTFASFTEIGNSPKELALGIGFTFLITVFYIATLYLAIRSFGLSLSFIDASFIYAVAVISRTAVPTPGGLGAVEVSMAAAMTGLGVASGTAYAVVILYRLVTFWLPIPFSYLAYRYINKQKYI